VEDPAAPGPSAGARAGHISTAGQLLAGGVAGAVSKTCTAPLARLTHSLPGLQPALAAGRALRHWQFLEAGGATFPPTRITRSLKEKGCASSGHGCTRCAVGARGVQVQAWTMRQLFATAGQSIWVEARRIFQEEGVMAFWKGNTVTIVHRLPYSAINFFAYETYKRWVSPPASSYSASSSFGRHTLSCCRPMGSACRAGTAEGCRCVLQGMLAREVCHLLLSAASSTPGALALAGRPWRSWRYGYVYGVESKGESRRGQQRGGGG